MILYEYYTILYSVDSLLQVHALHNLLDVLSLSNIDEPDKDKYQSELVRLEAKYMTNCSELVCIRNQLLLLNLAII